MNRNLKELIELSLIDKEIDSYTPKIEAANKHIAKAEKKIASVQEEIEEITANIQENHKKVKMFEEQIAMLSEQLKNNTKKAKDVSTEKELKALSLEEDIAKEKISFANEEIERLGAINEKKEAITKELEAQLAQSQNEFQEATKDSMQIKAEIEESKANLFGKREAISCDLEQKILAFYEKIRIWAGNTAVVPVRKQACYGCYMKISDKAYADVIKSSEIVTCPHCGRILYIESTQTEA